MRKTIRLPALMGAALLRADTAKPETRTVEATFYSGAPVMRVPLFGEPYELSFEMTPEAAKLGRLNAGAPVLDAHAGHSVRNVLGVVESARIASGEGRAVLRFSQRDDVEPIWRDVQAGILRSVSMGVYLDALEDVTAKGSDVRQVRATAWTPFEISLVPVPADAGATIHNAADDARPCVVLMGDRQMDDLDIDNDTTTEEPTAEELASAKAAKRAENKRLVREAKIRRYAEHFQVGDLWAERMLRADHLSLEEILSDAARLRSENTPHINGSNPDADRYALFGDSYDGGPLFIACRSEALAAKATGTEPTDRARRFMNVASFTGLAHEVLDQKRMHGWVDRGRAGDRRAVELALTTSDYPAILGDSARRVLVGRHEAAPATYRMLCARRNFTDYREHKFVSAGDFPIPLEVGEAGEIKFGFFAEKAETSRCFRYGRILKFSREALVNDDLGAFAEVMGSYGQRIADVENGLFFTLLTSAAGVGPTMSDGGAFFNATAVTTAGGHANLASSGTAISDTSLNLGAAAMMVQTGLGSTGLGDGIKLNIQPRFLLAAPAKRQLGIQYTSSNYSPAAPTSINTFSGILTPLFDANLSGNPWFLFADPAAMPAFTFGSLDSEPGPRVATRAGFETEGLEMRVAFDFGVAAIEWRAAYRNPGA